MFVKFFSWFYRILKNHCINYLRRKKTLSIIPFTTAFSRHGEEVNPDEFQADSGEEMSEQQRVVHDAINKLSIKHREVIILNDIEGYPQEEIAELLGISIGTVRSRIHYARENLKKLLQNYVNEIESSKDYHNSCIPNVNTSYCQC